MWELKLAILILGYKNYACEELIPMSAVKEKTNWAGRETGVSNNTSLSFGEGRGEAFYRHITVIRCMALTDK